MRAVCIDNWDGGNYLTVGKEYVVRDVDETRYYVMNDEGYGSKYYKDHFKLVEEVAETAKVVSEPPHNKYSREIKPGVFVDVYDVLQAFNVTDPCLQHLLKKALAVGQRGHKDAATDYKDILASAKRAVEMFEEWNTK